jgi:mycothiol synthase
MRLVGPVNHLSRGQADEAVALSDRAGRPLDHTPFADDTWRALVAPRPATDPASASAPSESGGRFTAAWAERPTGEWSGYVQLIRPPAEPAWTAEVMIDGSGPDAPSLADLGAPLLRRGLDGVAALGGGPVHLWAASATPSHAELAARLGLAPYRALHEMRRPLPVDEAYELPLRPFVPGRDEEAVVEVNRLAFAHHPAQGEMTRAMLEAREAQPWFDPAGFLLCELEGQLAGFCWTRLFADREPVLGEIHVICVHPDFGGRGLGRGLVLAGLDHLTRQGATVGMLFVEADNEAALDLYHRLKFEVVRTDRAFAITVTPASSLSKT